MIKTFFSSLFKRIIPTAKNTNSKVKLIPQDNKQNKDHVSSSPEKIETSSKSSMKRTQRNSQDQYDFDTRHRTTSKKSKKRDKNQFSSKLSGKQEQIVIQKEIPPMPELVVPEKIEGKTRFFDLSIHEKILAATQTLKFDYCTPIQEQSLPLLLKNVDFMGKSQTGTGKTAAFLITVFNFFLNHPKPNRTIGSCRAIVLAPTRELAMQIHQDAEALSQFCGFHNLVVFGGMDHEKQLHQLMAQPIDLLVGTPGRLLDYIRSHHLKLNDTEILVIDEADRMLDMGFIPDVTRIVSHLPVPGKRQTLFFSATFTEDVKNLVSRWLQNPQSIEIEPDSVVTNLIEQRFYSVLREEKFPFLLNLIKTENFTRMLVFGNRRDFNFELANKLKKYGIACDLLSGDVPQNKRFKILNRFKEGQIKILIATDVAARGIHVDDISHVINYDLPDQAEDYVHRIGRTGRAGQHGVAISFICEYGAYVVDSIEQLIGNPIKSIQPSSEMLLMPVQEKR